MTFFTLHSGGSPFHAPFSFFRQRTKCAQCDRIRCAKCLVQKPRPAAPPRPPPLGGCVQSPGRGDYNASLIGLTELHGATRHPPPGGGMCYRCLGGGVKHVRGREARPLRHPMRLW